MNRIGDFFSNITPYFKKIYNKSTYFYNNITEGIILSREESFINNTKNSKSLLISQGLISTSPYNVNDKNLFIEFLPDGKNFNEDDNEDEQWYVMKLHLY